MAYRIKEPEVTEPVASVSQRLDALAQYDILDSECERSYDDIAFLAKNLCQTPVALVSLVEKDRQWFKARDGFDACQTSIEQSVCRHGLCSRDVLVIPDLTKDSRTAENTLVTEAPHIRFYAGAPLVTPEDVAIGMLCVIDTVPRPEGLSADQQRGLVALARQVIDQLELRKALLGRERALVEQKHEAELLRRTAERLEFAEAAGHVGAFEMDLSTRDVIVSAEFCRLHGIEPVSRLAFAELERRVPHVRGIHETVESGPDEVRGEFLIHRADNGSDRWLDVRALYARDASGARRFLSGVVTDVTERRMINEEISHRLKNTMALVQAIAGHTLRGAASPEVMQEFNRRVSALATAHDILLRPSAQGAGVHAVANGVLAGLSVDDRVRPDGEDVQLSSRAVLVLAMLLHELSTNAIKYGALSCKEGRVTLRTAREARADGEWLVIDWAESGGPDVAAPTKLGLGTRLVKRGLAPDGEADLTYDPAGFRARICAPLSQIC